MPFLLALRSTRSFPPPGHARKGRLIMTALATESTPIRRPAKTKTVRLGLLGLGVVGQGLVRLLHERRPELRDAHGIECEVVRALVRDPQKARAEQASGCELTADASEFLAHEYDIVVEA